MELVPKQGYVFVDFDENKGNLDAEMYKGTVVSGIKEIGMVVFFKSYVNFSETNNPLLPKSKLVLVKLEDVLSWIKPEIKDEQIDNA